MRHLEATASILPIVLVILLAPSKLWGTATTATRFGQGSCGIHIANKEQHGNMSHVFDCCKIIVLWELSFVEENVLDSVWDPDTL